MSGGFHSHASRPEHPEAHDAQIRPGSRALPQPDRRHRRVAPGLQILTMDANRQSLLPTFVTEQLERVANRALHYAPLTRLQLHKLEGKSFGIELQRPHFPLLVSVTRKGLLFQS